ncbi:MAG: GNAT family protein [Bacteroidota bacterium]
MALLTPQRISLQTGETLLLRSAFREDAGMMLQHVHKVGSETDFLTFGAGEFDKTEAEEAQIVQNHLDADNQIFMLAFIEEELVGMMNVHARSRKRLRHVGEFGISVARAHWGKGIGQHMILAMIAWAKASGVIRKLNLMVNEENKRGIHIYKKLGFEVEGLLRRDFCLNGTFSDTYYMGMLID